MDDDTMTRAGIFVLGVLEADDAADTLAAADADPALAEAIAHWQAYLAPLARLAPPVSAPPGLWPRIEQRLSPRPRPAPRLTRARLLRWGIPAAAAAAAAFVLLRPRPLASLSNPYGATGWRVVASLGAIRVEPVAAPPAPAGHDWELWAISARGPAPVPLGLLRADRPLTLARLPEGTQQLLVSLERAGGSPSALPQGPVKFGGKVAS